MALQPPLILAQGLRGLQQSAATLTGSSYLIGFDIKNYHKQQKNTPTDGIQELFSKISLLVSSFVLLFYF